MLGLGTNIIKGGGGVKTIVTDNLVLKHNYNAGEVHQVSTGAAAMNLSSDASEHIDVGTIAIGTGDISISAWVYVTAFVDEAAIFSNRHASGDNQGIELRCDSDGFEMILDEAVTGSTTVATPAKNVNQWYHVCGVWDRSGNQYMYVDGVLDVTPDDITTRADSLAHTTTARIGRDAATSDFRGYICNVGYWNRVLTQAEVKSIWYKNYADLTAAEKTSLVSWWNLDSTIDSTQLSYDGSTTVGAGNTTVYDNHHGAGDTLGSELITGGDFGGGGANWTTTTGWDDTGGFGAWDTAAASSNRVYQTIDALVVGKTYKLMFTISNTSGGRQLVRLSGTGSNQDVTYLNDGSTAGYGTHINGIHTLYFTATHAHTVFSFYGHSSYDSFHVDDISLKLVNGNTGTLL